MNELLKIMRQARRSYTREEIATIANVNIDLLVSYGVLIKNKHPPRRNYRPRRLLTPVLMRGGVHISSRNQLCTKGPTT